MEIKDLILLMLIPIILVSIVVYTDKNPVITGAVTAKQEESNILGTYSIMPSFKAKIEYNLEEEYKNIKDSLNQIVEDCKNRGDIDQCFTDYSNKLGWNCDESKDEAVDILYDFVDKFKGCIELEEDGVVCRFSLDEREIMKLIGIFVILLTNENQKTKVELRHGTNIWTEYINLENLVYTVYDYKDTLNEKLNSVRIIIEYVNKKPIIKEVVGVDDYSNTIPLSKTLLLYKKDNNIKFVEAPGSSFELEAANKIIDLPRVKGFKFCAKTGKRFYAFDASDNQVKQREIVYKFAVTFPNPLAPPPVKVLTAEDKLKAEKSIVLKWSKVKQADGSEVEGFDHYNIYCSKTSIQDKITKEIKLDNLKPTMAVKADTHYDSWIVDINKCGNDNIQDGADYYFAATAVSKAKKESNAIAQASAKSVDDLAPGTQEIVLINSDGKKEEKTSSACINLPIGKDNQVGNIWAGFFAPAKNEDEITNIKADEQLTYLLHFSNQNPVTDNLNNCYRYKCVELDFASKDSIDYAPQRTFHKSKEFENPNTFFVEGQTYCFTIVARDNNYNLIKNIPYKFEPPSQWKEIDFKPVKRGFLNDKNEIVYS